MKKTLITSRCVFFAISSIYYLVDRNIDNLALVENVARAIKIQWPGHKKHITPNNFFPYLKSLNL